MIQGWKEEFMGDMRTCWKPWVPLLLLRTWAPTRCDSWVPLTTERRHGLSIRPVQNELAVTHVDIVDPARGPLRIDIGQGSDGLQRLLIPHPRHDTCRLLPNAHDGTDVRFPMTAAHQKVDSGLHVHVTHGNLAPHVPVIVTLPLLLHLTTGTGVARLPLVVLPGPTWLGGLLGVPHCRHVGVHRLIIGGPVDHPGAVSHHLRPAPGAIIVGWPHHPLGGLHLKGIGPLIPLHDVTAPGLPAQSVTLTLMTQTFAFCDSVQTMMISIPPVRIPVIPLIQDNLPQWMLLNYPRIKCRIFLLISLLLQLSRTMQILYLIVLQTNWYPMSGLLLPLLQLSITVNHWRRMDCSKITSLSIASREILRRRHVRLRTMIRLTLCYLKRRSHR